MTLALSLAGCGPIVVVSTPGGGGGGGERSSPAVPFSQPALLRLPAEIPLEFELEFDSSLASAVDGFFNTVQHDRHVADRWTEAFIKPGLNLMQQRLALRKVETKIWYTPRSKIHVELRGANEGTGDFLVNTALHRVLEPSPARDARYEWKAVTRVDFDFDPARPNSVVIRGNLNLGVTREVTATIYATEKTYSQMLQLYQNANPKNLATLADELNREILEVYRKHLVANYRLKMK